MGRPGADASGSGSGHQPPMPPAAADPNQDLYGPPPKHDDDYPHKQHNITHLQDSSSSAAAAAAFPPPAPAHHHQYEQYEYSKPQAFPPPQDLQEYAKPQAFPPPPPNPAAHFQQPNNIGIQMGHPAAAAAAPPPPPPPPLYGIQQIQQAPAPAVGIMQSPMIVNNNILLQDKPWTTHLFDCMSDPQNAIITLFCPCVTFGQIAEILDSGTTSCGTSGMWYGVIAFCIGMPCLISCSYRTKLRAKFGLTESPAPDWIIHCLCEHCALCQEYRELQNQGYDPSIGWVGNVAKMQKQQQQVGIAMIPPVHQQMM